MYYVSLILIFFFLKDETLEKTYYASSEYYILLAIYNTRKMEFHLKSYILVQYIIGFGSTLKIIVQDTYI